tara:strand:- start:10312 stop:10653 length:342 start_codon:yes stop_codon:yes gene_type:complete
VAAVDLIPVIAPELVDNPQLTGAIVMAEDQVAADHCRREQAVAYLAAHILTTAGRGGTGGAVASETEGSLSRSFASPEAAAGTLGSTGYGQELQRLNRICYGFSARTAWPVKV